MATFLTTAGTAHHLEQIVTRASERLVLVSPFLQLSPILLQRLQDANRRGVAITVVYGKSELSAAERGKLTQLNRVELRYLANLHAKCYANETHMIITSMNMYEFSEKKNREMSVLLCSDGDAYREAMAEIESMLAASEQVTVKPASATPMPTSGRRRDAAAAQSFGGMRLGNSTRDVRQANATNKSGLCIRCLETIPRNASRPLCYSCYDVWSAFGNPEYVERGCHYCGRPEQVSMARPLCYECYREDSAL